MGRLSWDQYFIKFAYLASERTTCIRRKVGAILVKDNHIIATGYNGAPRGIPHCTKETCIREQNNIPSGKCQELCRGLHAEQNLLIQAARTGIIVKDSSLYCTTFPCSTCAKMIINSGIIHVFYNEGYLDDMATEMFKQAGIRSVRLNV